MRWRSSEGVRFLTIDATSNDQDLIDRVVAVRPWDSFFFRFYKRVRDWAGTLFVLATAVPMQIDTVTLLLLLSVAMPGDFYVQKTALDRRISDLEFSERMIGGRGFPNAMGSGYRNFILRIASLGFLGVSLATPFATWLVVQTDLDEETSGVLSEAVLFTLILSSLGLLLTVSRSIEAIPVVKTPDQALDPGTWTAVASFGVGGPFASDALSKKHGSYLRWHGGLLLFGSFALTLGEKVNFSEIAVDGLPQIYAACIAYQVVFFLMGFCIFSIVVLPWKMRGFALITVLQGRLDRFSNSIQRKLEVK